MSTGPSERLLLGGALPAFIESISTAGQIALFRRLGAQTQNDIRVVRLSGEGPQPIVASAFNDIQPAFSPTGRRIAYASDESGHYEVYVTRYPGNDSRVQISADAGTQPTWRGHEKELFYIAPGDRIIAVPIAEAGGLWKPAEATEIAHVQLRPNRNDWQTALDGN